MGVVIHIGSSAGGGGTGAGWSGTVEFRADLPITIGTPAIGDVYLVQKPTTILFGSYTTYQSGLYIRDFDTGALSDWRKLNVKVKFTDSEFAIVSAGDESKQSKFDLSLITTGTTRTFQIPDKDGVIALLSDVEASNELSEVLVNGNITGGTDILTTNNDRIRPVNGDVFLDLRNGQNVIIEGTQVGGLPIVGFSYYFVGDFTFTFSVGLEIIVRGTNGGVNDGTHTLTAVNYDGVNTRIQWAGMTTELLAPFGELIVPQDGTSKYGSETAFFQRQNLFGVFELLVMSQRSSNKAFSEFYSFFGYTYIVSSDKEDVNPANHREGGLILHNNLTGSGTTSLGNFDVFPISASVNRIFWATLQKNAFAGGAKYITCKTDNAMYSRRFIINHEDDGGAFQGAPFETEIDSVYPTADRKQTLQDDNGTIALTKNIAISQAYTIQTILNAPIITADQDNYSPVGFDENTDLIRVDVDFNNRAISGIPAPPLGVFRILGIKNINTASLDLRFEHNNAGSLAPNRFLCRDNNNKSIKPNEMALWFYDHNVQRWTPFNRIG